MSEFKVKDPGERLDLGYLWADVSEADIIKLATAAEDVSAYGVVVHAAQLPALIADLHWSINISIVISFPDGQESLRAKETSASEARVFGANGADAVVNLRDVLERNEDKIVHECLALRRYLKNIKLISQVPYLWLHDQEGLWWLMNLLPKAGVYCIKDWTTRKNFSKPVDLTTDTRLRYTEAMANYIATKNLPLFIKIAGEIDKHTASRYLDAGADILGISYYTAKEIREALLQRQ